MAYPYLSNSLAEVDLTPSLPLAENQSHVLFTLRYPHLGLSFPIVSPCFTMEEGTVGDFAATGEPAVSGPWPTVEQNISSPALPNGIPRSP